MKENGQYFQPEDEEMNFPINNNIESDEVDSENSDARQLFKLPKRRVIRPPSMSLKRKVGAPNRCWINTKKCFSLCFTSALPLLVSVFVVSTILCMAFLLVGVANMKQQIHLLKIKLNHANSAQQHSVTQNELLRKEYKNKLKKIEDHQHEVESIKTIVNMLDKKLSRLNNTLREMRNSPTFQLTSKINEVKQDVGTLKAGMADTGAHIDRLIDTDKKFKTQLQHTSDEANNIQQKLYNLSVEVSKINNLPFPSLTTTPKTLVVTLTPDEDLPVKKKEFKKILADLENKQMLLCQQNSLQYIMKLDHLKNQTRMLNETFYEEFATLSKDLLAIKRTSEKNILNNTKHDNKVAIHKLRFKGNVTKSPVFTMPPSTRNTITRNTTFNNSIKKSETFPTMPMTKVLKTLQTANKTLNPTRILSTSTSIKKEPEKTLRQVHEKDRNFNSEESLKGNKASERDEILETLMKSLANENKPNTRYDNDFDSSDSYDENLKQNIRKKWRNRIERKPF